MRGREITQPDKFHLGPIDRNSGQGDSLTQYQLNWGLELQFQVRKVILISVIFRIWGGSYWGVYGDPFLTVLDQIERACVVYSERSFLNWSTFIFVAIKRNALNTHGRQIYNSFGHML